MQSLWVALILAQDNHSQIEAHLPPGARTYFLGPKGPDLLFSVPDLLFSVLAEQTNICERWLS